MIIASCSQSLATRFTLNMDNDQIEEFFQFAKRLVLRCGVIVRQGSKNVGKIYTKSDFYDLVTKYDGEIEEILIKAIKDKYPTHLFIGEEGSGNDKKIPELTNAPTWIIDPIDGTVNFCKKIPLSCISVALVVDKRTVVGIVYNPITDEFYHALRGKGAHLNDEPISVSPVTDIKQALIANEVSIASLASVRDEVLGRTREYVSRSLGIRCFGSAALTLCFVAKGMVEAFNIDHLWPWDIAAGALIVQESGGLVIATHGGEYDIMKPNVIAACTPSICEAMLEIVRTVG